MPVQVDLADIEVRIEALVAEQAKRCPEAFAAICGQDVITYGDLIVRADGVAAQLHASGVVADDIVGVSMDRSIDMLAGVLGVLRAGAAYLPLDPLFPAKRLQHMVKDSAAKHVLLDHAGEAFRDINTALIQSSSIHHSGSPSTQIGSPSSLAYVLYTSGSTGKPKGVAVEHRSVVNFLKSMAQEPGMNTDDVLLALTTLSFDISVLELFLPLITGACLVIAARKDATDPLALMRLIDKHNITVMQATPSTWRALAEANWMGGSGLKALCGGDVLTTELSRRLLPKVRELWNLYGPTETTVWATACKIPHGCERISIGLPIANTQVHIIDAEGRPVPTGVPGEIVIGGAGVARGYLGQPGLTRQKFLSDPFSEMPNARLYRTGDYGRRLPDGNLEFKERIDAQVKLRGFRIELGEIETALSMHTQIVEAVCKVIQSKAGDQQLAAYLRTIDNELIDDQSIRDWLRQSVPEYMIPQHFVRIQKVPLTLNGKVDRAALPPLLAPPANKATDDATFKTHTEARLADIFCEIFDLEAVGRGADFFELGGHSITAMRMLVKLQEVFEKQVTLDVIFNSSQLHEMASAIDKTETPKSLQIKETASDQEIAQYSTLAPVQKRIWTHAQLSPDAGFYQLSAAWRIEGAFDAQAFERAFCDFLRRHPIMNAQILTENGVPVMRYADGHTFTLKIENLACENSDVQKSEEIARERITVHQKEPLDLAHGELFFMKLFRLSPKQHILFFMPHHVIWDGLCFDIFLHELKTLYEACLADTTPKLTPIKRFDPERYSRLSYLETSENDLAYWLNVLSTDTPALDLPIDRERPQLFSHEGDKVEFDVSTEEIDRIREISKKHHCTTFTVFLAVWQAFLARITRQNDIVIGAPIHARVDEASTIGCFVNTLCLRQIIDVVEPFSLFLNQTKEFVHRAAAHQHAPIEELAQRMGIARDPSRTPLFQAMFTYEQLGDRPAALAEAELTELSLRTHATPTEFMLVIFEHNRSARGEIHFASTLFSNGLIESLKDNFLVFFRAALVEPDKSVRSLPLISDEEREHILQIGRGASKPQNASQSILRSIYDAAERAPNAQALSDKDKSTTYGRLIDRVDQWSGSLREAGVKRGDIIGVCIEKSSDAVAAILSVWRCGAAFLPLDPDFPVARLEHMVKDAGVEKILISEGAVSGISFSDKMLISTAELDVGPTARSAVEEMSHIDADANARAYVMYTSGSTGSPKGVEITHGALSNHIVSMLRAPGLSSRDRLLAVTTISFDIALLELLGPLCAGGEIIIAHNDDLVDGERLSEIIQERRITVMQATPATWRLLIDAEWKGDRKLKALCGGEAMPPQLAEELLPRVGSLWNMYGPTETTIWSTCCQITNGDDIHVGRPIENTNVYVLDDQGELLPKGVTGKIWIGGEGVAAGYLGRPDLTKQKFRADAFAGETGARMYNTGDRGRWRPDGSLEILGRDDDQVKIRGYRIELGDIESNLCAHEAVSEAAAVIRTDRTGEAALAAFVVFKSGMSATTTELRRWMKKRLPPYMTPQFITALAALPKTANRKIDRAALPEKFLSAQTQSQSAPPRSPEEKTLASVWAECLNLDTVSATDNFFDIGGQSLQAARVVAYMRERFEIEIAPRALIFETLEQLAAQISLQDKN
ncbi:MAG: amino acid adenylation domain-containing protein [Pseudomonadota bacterium]